MFVSYGLLTVEERRLGDRVAGVIRAHGMRPFIAQEVHSAGDLNSNVFEAVRICDAFLGIMQKRGTVAFQDYPPTERSSVWIQQEFAIFCYRAFVEGRSIPMRIYTERGIRREGVMEIAMANPIDFETPDEIAENVDHWLGGPDFDEHPVLRTREEMFKRRLSQTDADQKLLLEVIAAHCLQAGDFVGLKIVQNDFMALLGEQGVGTQGGSRFNAALKNLLRGELVGRREDSRESEAKVWIAKQWWALLLDEFRRQGRHLGSELR